MAADFVAGIANTAERAVGRLPEVPAVGEAHPVSEVEARLAMVVRNYPDPRLTGEALAEIQADLTAQVARSKILSDFPLENGAGPGFVFRVYRSDGQ